MYKNREDKNQNWRDCYHRNMKNPAYRKRINARKLNYIHTNIRAQLNRRFVGIKHRCTNPKHKDYLNYGGRGIKCEWLTFESFYTDMLDKYVKAKQEISGNICINRKNPNGNYSKENTEFISFVDNCRYDKRNSRYLTYKNETLIIADWAARLNVSRQAVRYRRESGWSPEAIIETPFNYANRYDARTKEATAPTKNPRSKSK